MADRRNEKTRLALKDALLELCQSRPLMDVSISELCQRANVSRSTFYLNYGNITDLVTEMKADFLTGLGFDQVHWSFVLEDCYGEGRYISDRRELFTFLCQYGDLKGFFVSHIRKLINVHVVKDKPELNTSIIDLGANYAASGVLSIIEYYFANYIDLKSEFVAEFLFKSTESIFEMLKQL